MAKSRKDLRGRALRPGEVQRKSDRRYMYTYTDSLGRRKYIYARDLNELREKEKKLIRDQLDGLDLYVSGKATVNDVFDRYIHLKPNLRESTRSNYLYTYDKFVRDTFGRKKIADIKYSDVLQFYYYLLQEKDLAIGTLESVQTLLHPTFQMAVRDAIIRTNPSDHVLAEIKKNSGKNKGVRHALTLEQQKAWMNYIANHPVYYHWWPIFTILLGTGCRIGEALGLRWEDLDFDKRIISINHALVYYPIGEDRRCQMRVSLPKTDAGIRIIPMLDVVEEAFEILLEEQEEYGPNNTVIDGMSGFIFTNKDGAVPRPEAINRAIKRITSSYNAEEIINASRQNREPVIVPDFSCHVLRHTFCTRLCENETNLKVIQSVMGHKDIQTTMDIYAEVTDTKKQQVFEELSLKLDCF